VRTVHVVVPDGIDDPDRPTGGNTYDRRLCRELAALGWSLQEHEIFGFWKRPGAGALRALDAALTRMADESLVLFDGLIASNGADALVAQIGRLRMVVLVHMPVAHRPQRDDVRRSESAALSAAAAVITTSEWARQRLTELYDLDPHRLHVAEPGVDAAPLASGTASGGSLLCVAAVTFEKGHDLLLEALRSVSDLAWHCVCVGSLDRDRAFVEQLDLAGGLRERVSFTGPHAGPDLDRDYASTDLLILPSRAETYGLVITEALARGVPVIASAVGGVAEALGHVRDGVRPGILVAPEDPAALGAALRAWLCDPELRARLRDAARERRAALRPWSETASAVARVLEAATR
jgi:glycosyltransferase involved in cell wall biosynthesis